MTFISALKNHEKQNWKMACFQTTIKTLAMQAMEKKKAILKRSLQDGSTMAL